MKTKIVSLAMAVVLVFAVNVSAFATTVPAKSSGGIHVMYTNTDDIKAAISIDGTCASCSGVVDAKSGTTKITATGLLKRVDSNGTTTVKTWTASVNGDALYFDKYYYVASGYTYQFQIVAKVYRNGTVENVSMTDSDYCG
jgi:hypothetical protein